MVFFYPQIKKTYVWKDHGLCRGTETLVFIPATVTQLYGRVTHLTAAGTPVQWPRGVLLELVQITSKFYARSVGADQVWKILNITIHVLFQST